MVNAIDLFCGAGGLTKGLEQAGVNVVAGFDNEIACKYAYEKNNDSTFFHQDVADIKAEDLQKIWGTSNYRLLAGCAPCQPFSTYNQGKDTKADRKWPLLYEFSRLIRETLPDFVTMENVQDVTKHDVYHDFVDELCKLGYKVTAQKVYCPDYGIPQKRKRHVLLASLKDRVTLVPATHTKEEYLTVKDVIGHLPKIKAGETHHSDPLHKCAILNPVNLERIKNSKQGGTWRDWPEHLLAKCHTKSSGKSYSGVYARMQWDKPAPTMTTQCFGYGNGRFGHPTQNRAISLREASIFQTFPKDYEFLPHQLINLKAIGKMIGNAVPVKLGKVIGQSFIETIK